MKIDFLIAGAQKCGTTALWEFMRLHPAVGLPDCKEMHFFDNEAIDWSCPPYEDLIREAYRPNNNASALGDATPIYTYWPPCVGRIHSYNPNIKLVILLRDPVARAFSHWRKEVRRGMETLAFDRAIREGRKRILDGAEFPGVHRIYSYVERGFYSEQVQRVFKLFDRKQVLFATTSDLRTRHRETLDRVTHFLGIPPFECYPEPRPVNSLVDFAVPRPAAEDIAYLRDLYRDDWRNTEDFIGCEIEREL